MIDLEEWAIRRDFLRKALSRLTPRRREIIRDALEGVPRSVTSDRYWISRARVGQIAKKVAVTLGELWEDELLWEEWYNKKIPLHYLGLTEEDDTTEVSNELRKILLHDQKKRKKRTHTAKPESPPDAWRLYWDASAQMIYWVNTVSNETKFWDRSEQSCDQ